MKINRLEIDGFGVWSDLKVEGLAEGLNIFYGRNEAGKTTLLQFVRSMLYGFSAQRRRYLPPVHGGRPGGEIDVSGPNGRFEIGRHQEDGAGEELTLTAPDGTRQGEHFLRVLLCNVDEAIFNNVFAFGLQEIQELGSLSDTEAAELLYRMTAGLDRVSLVDVMQALRTSRNRILDADGKPSQIAQLAAEREKLRTEIDELSSLTRQFGLLAAERVEADADIARFQEDVNRTEQQLAVVDLAAALRERWRQRVSLDDELASLGSLKPMPEKAIERLDAIRAKLQKHEHRLERLAKRRDSLKREFAALSVNESLCRQAARIEALKEQETWIKQIQTQIAEATAEIAATESQLREETERLGLGRDAALPDFQPKTLAALRSPAKTLRRCRQHRIEATEAAAQARQTVETLAQQISTALSARGESSLTEAMDRAGNLVLQLRRRVQIDERLEQLAQYQAEIEQRSRVLVGRQIMPVGILVGLGVTFAIGVLLILTGLFMPASVTASLGWAIAILGVLGSGAAAIGKVMHDRSNAHQLDACQKQLGVLQMQAQQTKEDRDHLDSQLPRSSGSAASRLQAAEKDLADLEELTPIETRRNGAKQEAETAARRLAEAEDEAKAAARRWRQAVAATGLPDGIAPQQVQRILQRCDQIAELQRRLVRIRDDQARRQQELNAVTARITQIAADGGVSLAGVDPIDHLAQLGKAVAEQEASASQRDGIRRQVRQLRTAQAKHTEAISRVKHRRRALLLEAGAEDEREYRERALRWARIDTLRRDRDALAHEIETAIASHCSEEVLRQQIENAGVPVERRCEDLRQRLASLQQQLHGRLEKRGQLAEQLRALAADRQLAEKHLALAEVEQKLREAIRRWHVLAVTCDVLERIRKTYEQDRQPETLCEASGYLDRLTQGHYHRVWTPLGENVLRVDDAEGNSLPVEVLSRGTREQLFLSLRLALTSSYARRGAALPLVLDDVLVNFDTERAKAAATVLRDFAAQGHQLLVFTCHEHILRMFKSLDVPVTQLPNNATGKPQVVRLVSHGEEKPPRPQESPAAASSRRRRADRPKKTREEEAPRVDDEDALPEEPDSDNDPFAGSEDELVEIRPRRERPKSRKRKNRDHDRAKPRKGDDPKSDDWQRTDTEGDEAEEAVEDDQVDDQVDEEAVEEEHEEDEYEELESFDASDWDDDSELDASDGDAEAA
jgi:uncharacterized protein YhaN